MTWQKTLLAPIQYYGETLHAGCSVTCRIKPSPPDTGILFTRNNYTIQASPYNITETQRCTLLGSRSEGIATVEHIMAAFLGCGIDNAHVIVDGPEVPILDGSAKPWVDAIITTGTQSQKSKKKFFIIKESFSWRNKNGSSLCVKPCNHLEINMTIDYMHTLIGRQNYSIIVTEESFRTNIAPARTFGFLKEIDILKKQKLARGASMNNTLVFDTDKLLNKETLRFPDECVRHKILDFCGDLFLAGYFLGQFDGYKTGHTAHNAFLCSLLESKKYEIVEI